MHGLMVTGKGTRDLSAKGLTTEAFIDEVANDLKEVADDTTISLTEKFAPISPKLRDNVDVDKLKAMFNKFD